MSEKKKLLKSAMDDGFKMPEVSVGDAVVFYPNGVVTPGAATVGFVRGVGRQCIEVVGLGHTGYEGVRHKDDPALARREIRESGCWDYTAGYKALLNRIEDSQGTGGGDVTVLKGQVTKLSNQVKAMAEQLAVLENEVLNLVADETTTSG